jgi:hypothetical protein
VRFAGYELSRWREGLKLIEISSLPDYPLCSLLDAAKYLIDTPADWCSDGNRSIWVNADRQSLAPAEFQRERNPLLAKGNY